MGGGVGAGAGVGAGVCVGWVWAWVWVCGCGGVRVGVGVDAGVRAGVGVWVYGCLRMCVVGGLPTVARCFSAMQIEFADMTARQQRAGAKAKAKKARATTSPE